MIKNERCLEQFLRWLLRLLAFFLQLPVFFWNKQHIPTMSFRLHKEGKEGEGKGMGGGKEKERWGGKGEQKGMGRGRGKK